MKRYYIPGYIIWEYFRDSRREFNDQLSFLQEMIEEYNEYGVVDMSRFNTKPQDDMWPEIGTVVIEGKSYPARRLPQQSATILLNAPQH